MCKTTSNTCLLDSQSGLFLSPMRRLVPADKRAVYDNAEHAAAARKECAVDGLFTVVEVADDVEEYRGCAIARPIAIDARRGEASCSFVVYIPAGLMSPKGRPTKAFFNLGPTVADCKRNIDSYCDRGWIREI
jgi:hypothetical protein